MISVEGYAILHNGKIVPSTVYEHERGAKANGLIIMFNIRPLQDWSDDDIHQTWSRCLAELEEQKPGEHTLDVVPVNVTLRAQA